MSQQQSQEKPQSQEKQKIGLDEELGGVELTNLSSLSSPQPASPETPPTVTLSEDSGAPLIPAPAPTTPELETLSPVSEEALDVDNQPLLRQRVSNTTRRPAATPETPETAPGSILQPPPQAYPLSSTTSSPTDEKEQGASSHDTAGSAKLAEAQYRSSETLNYHPYHIQSLSIQEAARFGTGINVLSYFIGMMVQCCPLCCFSPCCCKGHLVLGGGSVLSGASASAMKALEAGQVGNLSPQGIEAARFMVKEKFYPRDFLQVSYDMNVRRPLAENARLSEHSSEAYIRGLIGIGLNGFFGLAGSTLGYASRLVYPFVTLEKEINYLGWHLVASAFSGDKVGGITNPTTPFRAAVVNAIRDFLEYDTTKAAKKEGGTIGCLGNYAKRAVPMALGFALILGNMLTLSTLKQAAESDSIVQSLMFRTGQDLIGMLSARNKAEFGKHFASFMLNAVRLSFQLSSMIKPNLGSINPFEDPKNLLNIFPKFAGPSLPNIESSFVGVLKYLFSNSVAQWELLTSEKSFIGKLLDMNAYNRTKVYPDHLMAGLLEVLSTGSPAKKDKAWYYEYFPVPAVNRWLEKMWEADKAKYGYRDPSEGQAQTKLLDDLEVGQSHQELIKKIITDTTPKVVTRPDGLLRELKPSIENLAQNKNLTPAEKALIKDWSAEIATYQESSTESRVANIYRKINKLTSDFVSQRSEAEKLVNRIDGLWKYNFTGTPDEQQRQLQELSDTVNKSIKAIEDFYLVNGKAQEEFVKNNLKKLRDVKARIDQGGAIDKTIEDVSKLVDGFGKERRQQALEAKAKGKHDPADDPLLDPAALSDLSSPTTIPVEIELIAAGVSPEEVAKAKSFEEYRDKKHAGGDTGTTPIVEESEETVSNPASIVSHEPSTTGSASSSTASGLRATPPSISVHGPVPGSSGVSSTGTLAASSGDSVGVLQTTTLSRVSDPARQQGHTGAQAAASFWSVSLRSTQLPPATGSQPSVSQGTMGATSSTSSPDPTLTEGTSTNIPV